MKAQGHERLYTRWGKALQDNLILPEYPRPQFRRDSYLNLNGRWDYAIYPKGEKFRGYQGQIRVPFSPESILSGVERRLEPGEVLYYRRHFTVDKSFIKDKTLLHFGAVDCECRVKLNGRDVGGHRGGFLPFALDISAAVTPGENVLEVEVTDPTDTSYSSRGKQSLNRGGIWYTPQSGIWQTVWMESVPADHLRSVRLTPDIDQDLLYIRPAVEGRIQNVEVTITDKGKIIYQGTIKAGADSAIRLKDYRLWSPEDPYLYDLELAAGGDRVHSYFGMRKFGIGRDRKGILRLMLNNRPYFHSGLLDQGYWSDGMLTPPSNEAMLYDIKTVKELGFNMLRKHIKIEPLLWYHYCDREGVLVWQDMVNGGGRYRIFLLAALALLGINIKDTAKNYRLFSRANPAGRKEYYAELGAMIDLLYNCVSVCAWVPFNEGWGQFDALRAVDFIRERDGTRIVDHASGWHDQGGGDVNSRHIYVFKIKLPRDEKRAVVLSECGGYAHAVEGHVFNKGKTFGYKKFKSTAELNRAYRLLFEKQVIPQVEQGLSAVVYTQLSDVEDEVNGLLTYDRQVLKVDAAMVKSLNQKLREALKI